MAATVRVPWKVSTVVNGTASPRALDAGAGAGLERLISRLERRFRLSLSGVAGLVAIGGVEAVAGTLEGVSG